MKKRILLHLVGLIFLATLLGSCASTSRLYHSSYSTAALVDGIWGDWKKINENSYSSNKLTISSDGTMVYREKDAHPSQFIWRLKLHNYQREWTTKWQKKVVKGVWEEYNGVLEYRYSESSSLKRHLLEKGMLDGTSSDPVRQIPATVSLIHGENYTTYSIYFQEEGSTLGFAIEEYYQ